MNGNVIREFLVGLGFKVDEAGFRRMTSNIQQLTKNAALLAAGIYATAGAIGAAVTKIAKEFETLFYLSQRAGTTAANLTSVQFAFSQIGMSAEDASSAIDGLSKAMRENPGIRVLVNSLGVATTGQNGRLRDTADVAIDLLNTLAKMDPMLSSRYAGMLGISEGAVNAVRNNPGGIEAARARALQMQKDAGVDLNAIAETSRNFMNEIKTIWGQIELIFAGLAADIMAKVMPSMELVRQWLADHSKEIRQIGGQMSDSFGHLLGDVNALIPKIDELVEKTIGWQRALEFIADVVIVKMLGRLGLILVLIQKLSSLDAGDASTWWEKLKKDFIWNKPGFKLEDLLDPKTWMQNEGKPLGGTPQSATEPGLRHNLSFSPGGGGGGGNPQLAPDIEAEVRRQAALQGIDPERAVALFRAEGGGYSNVSSAGAIGPGQLLPGTANDLGVNPWNWRDNVKGGVMYFAQALRKFGGNYDSAEAAYNAGPNSGLVAKFNETGDRRWLPAETQQYLNNIDANYRAGTRGGSTPASVTQTNNFNINGSNAEQVASAVARRTRENADQIRYGLGSQLA